MYVCMCVCTIIPYAPVTYLCSGFAFSDCTASSCTVLWYSTVPGTVTKQESTKWSVFSSCCFLRAHSSHSISTNYFRFFQRPRRLVQNSTEQLEMPAAFVASNCKTSGRAVIFKIAFGIIACCIVVKFQTYQYCTVSRLPTTYRSCFLLCFFSSWFLGHPLLIQLLHCSTHYITLHYVISRKNKDNNILT